MRDRCHGSWERQDRGCSFRGDIARSRVEVSMALAVLLAGQSSWIGLMRLLESELSSHSW